MKNVNLIILLLSSWYDSSDGQRTVFDVLVPQLRLARELLLNTTRSSGNNLHLAGDLQKLQPRLSDDIQFPCSVKKGRSKKRPQSVHRLRPGDIDVIGALGDSLVAGNGLSATNLLQIVIENRGLSFAGGGQGTWREFLTLPNILKEYNPKLVGYAFGDGFPHQAIAQFNAAEAGAMSADTPFMSLELVRRMKTNPRVNVTSDWKLISIMIGPNDFCADMCYHPNPEDVLENHRKDLYQVFRNLRDNLPRTVVNLIVTPDLRTLTNTTVANRPSICYITHNFECPCLFGLQFEKMQDKLSEVMKKWQQVDIEVANDPEFDRDDFTIIVQPFASSYMLPKSKDGLTDYSSLSEDCFHLSQKEGARVALSLWNNMLQPVGSKKRTPDNLYDFKCPSKSNPYIFTRRNTKQKA